MSTTEICLIVIAVSQVARACITFMTAGKALHKIEVTLRRVACSLEDEEDDDNDDDGEWWKSPAGQTP